MGKVFWHADGRSTPYPPSREDAKKLRIRLYDSDVTCTVCNDCTIRFVKSDRCIHCRRQAAVDYYEANWEIARSADVAIQRDQERWVSPYMCEVDGHVGLKTVSTGECIECVLAKSIKSPRQQAIAKGERWYMPVDICPDCKTFAPRYVSNGRCKGCPLSMPKIPSSRQRAITDGRRWYVPTTKCRRCNKLAMRYVANGRCLGCSPLKAADNEPLLSGDLVLLDHWPGLVYSREQAAAWGVTIYRTGLQCTRGHVQYRYVTTGECVGCVGRG